jgi:hypothetical protein
MGVHGDRPSRGLADHLRHKRDPGGPSDEEDPRDIGHVDAGAADGALEGGDGLGQAGPDHRLELGSRQPDLGLEARQHDRDRHVGVGRERLLGQANLGAQPCQGRPGHRIGRIGLAHLAGEGVVDVGEDGLVEVDPAEALHPLGLAEDLEAVDRLAEDGGVEGPAAEVVDRHDLAGLEPILLGVVDGGRLGLR